MAPPKPNAPAVKAAKPVRLSREGATLAGAIYALAVAEQLKTNLPNETKLKQLSDASTAAAAAFQPVLEAVDGYDEPDDDRDPPTGGEATAPITTR